MTKAHWEGGTGGKGSAPRRMEISQDEWANRWDAIFQRDLKEENKDNESSSDNTDNRKSSTE